MEEYIKKSDLLYTLYNTKKLLEQQGFTKETSTTYGTLCATIDLIEHFPTVQTMEVRRGRWLNKCYASNKKTGSWFHTCSICNEETVQTSFNQAYCPCCGSLMSLGG